MIEEFQHGAPDIYSRVESTLILSAYQFCHNNQIQTAQLLGISRNVLRARLAKLGVIAGRASSTQREEERAEDSERLDDSGELATARSDSTSSPFRQAPRSLLCGGC